MKPNHNVSVLLSSLSDAQAMATALGFNFVAFLIGMAILEACNAADPEEDSGIPEARTGTSLR
jgi:hypothetical protein